MQLARFSNITICKYNIISTYIKEKRLFMLKQPLFFYVIFAILLLCRIISFYRPIWILIDRRIGIGIPVVR